MAEKTHAVAFYGTTRYKTKVLVSYKQRYVKRRKDGVKQRYWLKVARSTSKFVKGGERLTVFGSAKDVAQVKNKIDRESWIPKRKFQDRVDAKGFLKSPEKYARKGDWVEREKKES
jgi:hypothetical protein